MQSLQVLLAMGEKGKGIAKTGKKKKSLFYLNKLFKKKIKTTYHQQYLALHIY